MESRHARNNSRVFQLTTIMDTAIDGSCGPKGRAIALGIMGPTLLDIRSIITWVPNHSVTMTGQMMVTAKPIRILAITHGSSVDSCTTVRLATPLAALQARSAIEYRLMRIMPWTITTLIDALQA